MAESSLTAAQKLTLMDAFKADSVPKEEAQRRKNIVNELKIANDAIRDEAKTERDIERHKKDAEAEGQLKSIAQGCSGEGREKGSRRPDESGDSEETPRSADVEDARSVRPVPQVLARRRRRRSGRSSGFSPEPAG